MPKLVRSIVVFSIALAATLAIGWTVTTASRAIHARPVAMRYRASDVVSGDPSDAVAWYLFWSTGV